MAEPRGIDARLAWMLVNPPNRVGMCARTCWLALGGDRGNPPAWGTPHANAVYDKVIASGRYWTGRPRKGALVLWRYGRYGHAALCSDFAGTRILTTDPSGRPGKTGIEPLDYPKKWGAVRSRRIWTDQYNGVRFDVAPKEASKLTTWQRYSGKPAGTLKVVPGDYVRLDVDVEDPPFAGLESHLLYVNATPKWRITDKKHPDYWAQGAVIRTKYVREGGDSTAYNDRFISPHSAVWLITDGDHWEVGERGIGGRWWLRVRGDVEFVELGTRYCKTSVVA